jgi:hypothetical protein
LIAAGWRAIDPANLPTTLKGRASDTRGTKWENHRNGDGRQMCRHLGSSVGLFDGEGLGFHDWQLPC